MTRLPRPDDSFECKGTSRVQSMWCHLIQLRKRQYIQVGGQKLTVRKCRKLITWLEQACERIEGK